LIDLATTEPLVPLGDLIERLAELEQRIARGGGGGPSKAALKMTASGTPPPPPQRSASPSGTTEQATGNRQQATTTSAPAPASRPAPRPVETTATPAAPLTAVQSAPVAAPSGPVPKPDKVASGSGPQLAVPASADAALRAWNDLLGQLEARRKFSLLTYYQPARVLKWTTEELELGFAVDVHHMGEMAAEKDNIEDLRSLLRELGQQVKVSVRMLDERESTGSNARSILEAPGGYTRAHQRRAEPPRSRGARAPDDQAGPPDLRRPDQGDQDRCLTARWI
jgi:hypothetical protein